jgi:hypothetical protein
MTKYWPRLRLAFVPLVVLMIVAALVVWMAPPEKTMGYGIRPVYVHVALIWTGMAGLAVTAVIGLGLAWHGRVNWGAWLDTVGWVTLGFLAASFLASLSAQLSNWNGIFWDEPRSQAAGRAIAVWAVILIAGRWLHWPRLRGLAAGVAGPLLIASMHFSPLVLHPGDPITMADSQGIQVSFILLGVLSLAAGIAVVWILRPGAAPASVQPEAPAKPNESRIA